MFGRWVDNQKLNLDGDDVTKEEADRIVCEALAEVVAEQPILLEIDVSERAVCHHLARYIALMVPPELDVDVEYNRHHDDPKRLNLPHRRALDDELRATTVFPDIIVHVRDTDEYNEIVLELKKPGEPLEYDERKLRAFHNELKYRHCGHVILGVDGRGNLVSRVQWLNV